MVDARAADHAAENQRIPPVGNHAVGQIEKGAVHVVRRHGRADAVDMCVATFLSRPAALAARYGAKLQADALSLL